MQVKCGNHNGQVVYHATAAEVRDCYTGSGVASHWAGGMAEQDQSETLHRLRTQHARNAATRPTAVAEVDRRHDLATPPQAKFLRSLLATRVIPASRAQWLARIEQELGNEDQEWGNDGDGDMGALTPRTLTKRAASEAISALKGYAFKPRQAAPGAPAIGPVTQDGMYRNPRTGDVFKVQFNRATGDGRALYASRLVVDVEPVTDERGDVITRGKRHFQYVSGLINRIDPAWRMTIEEAKKFGALYGTCVYGHPLTKEESIRKGIGPVCEERYGMPGSR